MSKTPKIKRRQALTGAVAAGPALAAATRSAVKKDEPALIDAVWQPR